MEVDFDSMDFVTVTSVVHCYWYTYTLAQMKPMISVQLAYLRVINLLIQYLLSLCLPQSSIGAVSRICREAGFYLQRSKHTQGNASFPFLPHLVPCLPSIPIFFSRVSRIPHNGRSSHASHASQAVPVQFLQRL